MRATKRAKGVGTDPPRYRLRARRESEAQSTGEPGQASSSRHTQPPSPNPPIQNSAQEDAEIVDFLNLLETLQVALPISTTPQTSDLLSSGNSNSHFQFRHWLFAACKIANVDAPAPATCGIYWMMLKAHRSDLLWRFSQLAKASNKLSGPPKRAKDEDAVATTETQKKATRVKMSDEAKGAAKRRNQAKKNLKKKGLSKAEIDDKMQEYDELNPKPITMATAYTQESYVTKRGKEKGEKRKIREETMLQAEEEQPGPSSSKRQRSGEPPVVTDTPPEAAGSLSMPLHEAFVREAKQDDTSWISQTISPLHSQSPERSPLPSLWANQLDDEGQTNTREPTPEYPRSSLEAEALPFWGSGFYYDSDTSSYTTEHQFPSPPPLTDTTWVDDTLDRIDEQQSRSCVEEGQSLIDPLNNLSLPLESGLDEYLEDSVEDYNTHGVVDYHSIAVNLAHFGHFLSDQP